MHQIYQILFADKYFKTTNCSLKLLFSGQLLILPHMRIPSLPR